MGIYNRDYVRDPPPSSGWGNSHTTSHGGNEWFVKYLLIANIAVFLLDSLSGHALLDALQLDFFREGIVTSAIPELGIEAGSRAQWIEGRKAPDGWYVIHGNLGTPVDASRVETSYIKNYQLAWRLVTYGFLHDPHGINHIAFNMIGVWVFGRMLGRVYSSRELLSFYLCAVIFAGVLHLLYGLATHTFRPAIGASGGVFGLAFLTAVRFPRERLLLMLVIPVEMRFVAVLYAVTGIFAAGENVAHMAHAGGAIFGLAYGYWNWHLTGLAGGLLGRGIFRIPRLRKPKIRIYDPAKEPVPSGQVDSLDEEVDRILAKINATGEASLTPAERAKLIAASQRAKERRRDI